MNGSQVSSTATGDCTQGQKGTTNNSKLTNDQDGGPSTGKNDDPIKIIIKYEMDVGQVDVDEKKDIKENFDLNNNKPIRKIEQIDKGKPFDLIIYYESDYPIKLNLFSPFDTSKLDKAKQEQIKKYYEKAINDGLWFDEDGSFKDAGEIKFGY